MRFGPVAFLLIVPTGWAVVRSIMLWPQAEAPPARRVVYAPATTRGRDAAPPRLGLGSNKPEGLIFKPRHQSRTRVLQPDGGTQRAASPVEVAAASSPAIEHRASPDRVSESPAPFSILRRARSQRFDLSAWAIVRGDVRPGLATAGQLGGSQAGLRGRYRLNGHLHLAARLSGPIRSRLGKEAAIALDVRPSADLSVAVTLERRFGLDRGGRDALAIGLFGGVDRALTPALRLDGYAQAGVVGIRRRDAYVDGMVRVEHRVTGRDRTRVGVGAGLWGGAQPGVARLDAGPQIVGHFRTGFASVRLSAEWRHRVAGNARPGSGPVLSLGADF